MSSATNATSTARLPAVGLIGNASGDPYGVPIMCGAAETLSERGFHTLCFNGGFPSAPLYLGADGAPSVPPALKGLILLSASLRGYDRDLARLAAQSAPHVVSVGSEVDRAHTVVAHDEAAVFQAVLHSVKCHGRRKVAFIAGPVGSADAERRLRGYRAALQTLDLVVDPALIVRGDFEAQSGHEAVLQLRRFGSARFDAIVAANDLMAIGAIEGLRAAKLRVPDDVAVIGFDDMVEASFAAPSLTTIRQPVYEQGVSAARVLLRQLSGTLTEVSATLVPSPLIIRASCGCTPAERAPELPSAPNARDEERPGYALRGLLSRELATRRKQRELSALGEQLIAVADFNELATVMTRVFRLLDMRRFLLCLYTHDDRRARVVLESKGREVVFLSNGSSFPTAQLLPSSFLDGQNPLQLTIEPLTVRSEHFGYMVLDTELRNANCRVELRHFLSSALSRIARGRELRQLYADLRQVRHSRQTFTAVTDSERPAASTLAPRPMSRYPSESDVDSSEVK